jgi:lysylphosphatidylglycerol synthetase-like protein (DUF2156 family)
LASAYIGLALFQQEGSPQKVFNWYLFLAFTLFWLIFMAYAWTLARRQAKSRKDLEQLRAKIEGRSRSDTQAHSGP